MTIDILPDVALLTIFYFFVDEEVAWHTLVHVCQKWRNVVFGSQRRLNVRILYKPGTQAREVLDFWSPLPIFVWYKGYKKWGMDDILATLAERNDRIGRLDLLDIPSWQLETILEAMRQPFPALTWLNLWSRNRSLPVQPDSFLGGSAPRLQALFLDSIPFPGLPKLLLSAPHLVRLVIWNISNYAHLSSEVMITCLSELTRLERLDIRFDSFKQLPYQRSQLSHPPTRTLLPVLTELQFKGTIGFLVDLVDHIHAPRIDKLTAFFHNPIVLDTPQLTQFISRANFDAHDKAYVKFSQSDISVTLSQTSNGVLTLAIPYSLTVLSSQPRLQLSSLARLCGSSFPRDLISTVERLYILEDDLDDGPRPPWRYPVESSQWLDVFRPFTAVKGLYLSQEFGSRTVVPALQDLIKQEALPALQTLFLEVPLPSRPVQKLIEQFIVARRLASRPISLSCWEKSVLND